MGRFYSIRYRERILIRSAFYLRGVLGALLLLVSTQLHAAPLGLSPPANVPDFGADFLDVTYVATSDTFQVTGFVTDYANGAVPLLGVGVYALKATITHDGLLTAGTLTIEGDIGAGAQTLLTGALNTGASGTAFGFMGPPGGSLFEFLFTPTGGAPAVVQEFGGLNGQNCGIVLDAWFGNDDAGFDGSWTKDFSNDGFSGLSDTFAKVPEPASIALVLLGGICCAVSLRRRR